MLLTTPTLDMKASCALGDMSCEPRTQAQTGGKDYEVHALGIVLAMHISNGRVMYRFEV